MTKRIESVLQQVDFYWTKDLIIRFLYKELAPCFYRDLTFYLASKEEQKNSLKMEVFLVFLQ